MSFIEIDGSLGEGGGQILRTSLALSMVTGKPFRMRQIRAKRENPGLQRQHLTAVRAAAEVSGALAEGAELGSSTLEFSPGGVKPGSYAFDIGSAGSTGLVLQTVLPALLLCGGPSTVEIAGGTHNSQSPPFEFLAASFAPLLRKMGFGLDLELLRHGFYPAGGGRIRARIQPPEGRKAGPPLRAFGVPLVLEERGKALRTAATVLLSRLPDHIGRRELEHLQKRLHLDPAYFQLRDVKDSAGPGNVLLLEVHAEAVVEVVTAFGEKGVKAEDTAEKLALEAEAYLGGSHPVGPHLADQILLPMALAAGGSFITSEPTAHTLTNMAAIRAFLRTDFALAEVSPGHFRITVTRK